MLVPGLVQGDQFALDQRYHLRVVVVSRGIASPEGLGLLRHQQKYAVEQYQFGSFPSLIFSNCCQTICYSSSPLRQCPASASLLSVSAHPRFYPRGFGCLSLFVVASGPSLALICSSLARMDLSSSCRISQLWGWRWRVLLAMAFWNCCSMPLICWWRRLFLSCLALATDGAFVRGGECSILILSRLAMRTGLSSSIRSAKPILCSGSHFSIFFRRLVSYGEYLLLASLSWLSIFYSNTSRLFLSALSEDRAWGEMQSGESMHIWRARRPTQKMSPLPPSSSGSSTPSLSRAMCSGGRQASAAYFASCLLARARAIWQLVGMRKRRLQTRRYFPSRSRRIVSGRTAPCVTSQ